jgi:hypothetical protein
MMAIWEGECCLMEWNSIWRRITAMKLGKGKVHKEKKLCTMSSSKSEHIVQLREKEAWGMDRPQHYYFFFHGLLCSAVLVFYVKYEYATENHI